MLVLDRREPQELENHIRSLGIPVCRTVELDFGDVRFSGNGEFGECMVGVERKRLSDLVNSMKDRRLAGHQIRGMWTQHDYCYLIAEGMWRPGRAGEIEEWGWVQREKKNGWRTAYGDADRVAVSYRQVDAFLNTLSLKSRGRGGEPLIVKRSQSVYETAVLLVDLYKWFTDKQWSQHHSHDQVYCNVEVKKGHGSQWAEPHSHDEDFATGKRVGIRAGFEQKVPTTLWRAAMQLPGVDRRAELVAGHFGSLIEMAIAGLTAEMKEIVLRYLRDHPEEAEREWRGIDGFGPKTAAAVVRAVLERGA
jgi:ERCC4-type nuclease